MKWQENSRYLHQDSVANLTSFFPFPPSSARKENHFESHLYLEIYLMSVIWTCHTFENNFEIKHLYPNLLKRIWVDRVLMNNFTLNIWLKRLEKSCRTDLPILVFHVRIHEDTAPKVCYTPDLGSWAEPGKKW